MNEVKKCKARFSASEEDAEKLRPVTIRFPEEIWKALRDTSSARGYSMASLVRQLVEWGLSDMDEHTLQEEQISALHDAVIKLTDEISQIQRELNRIGVNYNQEVRLKNIERKYANRKNLEDRASYFREMDAIKNGSTTLNKKELDSLMSRYEEATQKAGEAICRILG